MVLQLKENMLYSVRVHFGIYFWNDINLINIIPKSRFKLMSWSGNWEFPEFCHLFCSVLLLPTAVPVKYVVLFFFSFDKQGRCPKCSTFLLDLRMFLDLIHRCYAQIKQSRFETSLYRDFSHFFGRALVSILKNFSLKKSLGIDLKSFGLNKDSESEIHYS